MSASAISDLAIHERSLSFVRYLSCLHACGWPPLGPDGRVDRFVAETFDARFRRDLYRDLVVKAATTPGSTSDATWAGPLAAVAPLANAFISYVYGAAILGKLPLRAVPFNVSVPMQTSGGSFAWAGEGKVKAVGKLDYAPVSIKVAKAVGDVIVSDELLRLMTPGTETFLRDALASGVAEFVDKQFCDPAVAPLDTVHPGSITNGVTPIAPSGTTSAALVADVGKLLGEFFTNNADVERAALLMTPSVASMLVAATKVPTLTMTGGSYAGVPVVTSKSVGTTVIAVDASAILYATGEIEMRASPNALVQMDSAPTDPPVAATVVASLWQLGLTALRAEWFVNWTRARTSAVSLISPTAYAPGT